jgi:hypothetical protein
MMIKYVIAFFILCNFGFRTIEVAQEKSLIVAEYKKNNSGYSYLVSYNFRDGKYISKDTILGSKMGPDKDIPWFHVRYDLGHNFSYQNRYVVSGTGHVVDLQTRSFVMQASDVFIEAMGDTLLFHRNNIWAGSGYLVLDLKTKSYGFVEDKNFRAVKGLHAPDHRHGIDVDYSKLTRAILLYDEKNSADTIVMNGGWGTLMSPHSSSHGKVPLFWLDNSNFIYADYARPRSYPEQTLVTVTIRKVNIDTRVNEIVGEIDSVGQAIVNSKFWRDDEDDLVYYCKGGLYKIDYKNNQVSRYVKKKIENGFHVANSNEKSKISYNDELIGEFVCGDRVTTNGYFAAEYGVQSASMSYPKGVKVWSATTKEWTTLNIPWVSAIIGWVDK